MPRKFKGRMMFMNNECPKCKGAMVEQEMSPTIKTHVAGFIGVRNLKPFVCKECGFIELWAR